MEEDRGVHNLFEDQGGLSDLLAGSVRFASQSSTLARLLDQALTLPSEFGLPVQVRDAALGRKNAAPTSDINKRE
jgi:hypothetical protein